MTARTASPHPTRVVAYATFARDFSVDDGYDAGCTKVAIEFLYPFLDLRLLRYLLTVPAVPWCRDKCLIRTALLGLLPEAVRLRPKTPAPGFPHRMRAQRSEPPELPAAPALARYVDAGKLPKWPGRNREELDQIFRTIGLHYWLAGL